MILGETLTASIDPGLVLKIVNNVCTLPSRRLIDLALFLFLFFFPGGFKRGVHSHSPSSCDSSSFPSIWTIVATVRHACRKSKGEFRLGGETSNSFRPVCCFRGRPLLKRSTILYGNTVPKWNASIFLGGCLLGTFYEYGTSSVVVYCFPVQRSLVPFLTPSPTIPLHVIFYYLHVCVFPRLIC